MWKGDVRKILLPVSRKLTDTVTLIEIARRLDELVCVVYGRRHLLRIGERALVRVPLSRKAVVCLTDLGFSMHATLALQQVVSFR